jgi:hypothetical protein
MVASRLDQSPARSRHPVVPCPVGNLLAGTPGIPGRSLTPPVLRCTLGLSVSVQVHLPMQAKGSGPLAVTTHVMFPSLETLHTDWLAIHKLQTPKGVNWDYGGGAESR